MRVPNDGLICAHLKSVMSPILQISISCIGINIFSKELPIDAFDNFCYMLSKLHVYGSFFRCFVLS